MSTNGFTGLGGGLVLNDSSKVTPALGHRELCGGESQRLDGAKESPGGQGPGLQCFLGSLPSVSVALSTVVSTPGLRFLLPI